MIARVATAGAFALALACAAGCTQTRGPHSPQNADERLADNVMNALLRDDMRPVIGDFVPERIPDLSSAEHVKQMHDYIRGGGTFLGARELDSPDPSTRDFVASFENGEVALQITMNGRGKIVHYHIGGVASKP